MQGEEGIDYMVASASDPRLPNDKVLEKQIRQEIN